MGRNINKREWDEHRCRVVYHEKKDVIDRHRRRNWWFSIVTAKKYLIVSLAVRNNNFSIFFFFDGAGDSMHNTWPLLIFSSSLSWSLHVLFIAHYMNKLFLFLLSISVLPLNAWAASRPRNHHRNILFLWFRSTQQTLTRKILLWFLDYLFKLEVLMTSCCLLHPDRISQYQID